MADEEDAGEWQEVNFKQKKKERYRETKRQKELERMQRETLRVPEDADDFDAPTSPVHIARRDAVREDDNPFTVFETKARSSSSKKEAPPEKKPGKKKKKKAQAAARSEQAPTSITVELLKNTSSDAAARYPNNTDLQMKILTEVFEKHMGTREEFDPAQEFAANASSTKAFVDLLAPPLCHLSDHVIEWTQNWFASVPKDDVEEFFWFLVSQITGVNPKERVPRDTNGNGLRAVLQLIVRAQPEAISHSRQPHEFHDRIAPLLSERVQAPEYMIQEPVEVVPALEVPGFVWIFGQFLDAEPRAALNMWYSYLLPLLCTDKGSDLTISLVLLFISAVLAKSGKKLRKRKLDKSVSRIAFERAMHVAYSSSLSSSQRHQFLQIYQAIKVLTIHATPTHYFPMLLSHAATDKGGERQLELREEVLACLAHSLHISEDCFRVWEEIYVYFVAQSNNLLLYIYLNWDKLSDKLPSGLLVERAEGFIQVNKALRSGKYRVRLPKRMSGKHELKLSREDIKMCTITCKAVIKRIRKSKVTLPWVILTLLVVLCAVVYMNCFVEGCVAGWCERITDCSAAAVESLEEAVVGGTGGDAANPERLL
eukprot:TRINITY_DN6448_c0_g1_i3.p1 TRINITY_DN6448_c0_g1~~TRINITY_DN6448_c0_g1_i3.p1  ORF type:complete len:597 (+),score=187.86 TRINITY_DN6448_c0_g1_i3:122-1912(+)